MKTLSTYHIKQNKSNDNSTVLIITDSDPEGMTLTIKDNSPNGSMTSFNLPRQEMLDALRYIFAKAESTNHIKIQPDAIQELKKEIINTVLMNIKNNVKMMDDISKDSVKTLIDSFFIH